MCTAILLKTDYNTLFGRTLDLEYTYNENIIIVPRNFKFLFNHKKISKHYAIIGIGIEIDKYPLLYDAMNEHGLCMAGLNFPESAVYNDEISDCINLGEYEFIPYILSRCRNIKEALNELEKINITNKSFNDVFKKTHLHWIISDKNESITVEFTKSGKIIYNNILNTLTNEPEFNQIVDSYNETNNYYPGDYSSISRFIKTSYILKKSKPIGLENIISHFFHILSQVSVINGIKEINNNYQKTIYTSCYDTNNLELLYKTYSNSQISRVKLNNINNYNLTIYPMITKEVIFDQN